MQKKAKILIWVTISALFVFFGGGAIFKFNDDANYKTGVQAVTAEITDATRTSRWRRFHKTVRYKFTYEFAAGGKTYTDTFETGEKGSVTFLEKPQVEVVYKIADPTVHKLKTSIGESQTVGDIAWSLAKALMIALVVGYLLGYMIASKLGWIIDDEEKDSDASPK